MSESIGLAERGVVFSRLTCEDTTGGWFATLLVFLFDSYLLVCSNSLCVTSCSTISFSISFSLWEFLIPEFALFCTASRSIYSRSSLIWYWLFSYTVRTSSRLLSYILLVFSSSSLYRLTLSSLYFSNSSIYLWSFLLRSFSLWQSEAKESARTAQRSKTPKRPKS